MARLSMHMLDTVSGEGAGNIRVDFSKLEGGSYKLIRSITTNEVGRTADPLMSGDTIATGSYQFEVYVAEYYAKKGIKLESGPFFDKLPVRFTVFDATQNYHVPVLFSPWGYTTYRGQ
ncbi:hydroxyisourate hydrolase [Uliginosibacterium sp. H3]|uniref:5-hydroxyisourate hydrolase n=1 Tax=Uliginosibacterium silvisoli TaxID=3114758 RepID=A0ABU6K234_9RHOO|nr:hydroxyisourate hydrolase [Uliginosibacterium sp. H3]